MVEFTSVSGSDRAITDITLMATIIRTGITTGHTIGATGIAIIGIIPITITGIE
jgi:hypothetical protein